MALVDGFASFVEADDRVSFDEEGDETPFDFGSGGGANDGGGGRSMVTFFFAC